MPQIVGWPFMAALMVEGAANVKVQRHLAPARAT
jgi:hypothetical protein